VYSQTFLAHLDSVAARCNYSDYIKKYLRYPPHGLLPLPGASTDFDPGCDVWDEIVTAATLLNPAFDYYHIFDMVSALSNCGCYSCVLDTFSQWPIMSDVLYP
jgi:hypothetical protein